jgi:hypothetical protein
MLTSPSRRCALAFDMMYTSRTHPGVLGDLEMFATGGANGH